MEYTENSVEDMCHYALLAAASYEHPDFLEFNPYYQSALKAELELNRRVRPYI